MCFKTNFMPAILTYTEICGEELSKMLAAWEFIIYIIFEGFHLSAAYKQMGFNIWFPWILIKIGNVEVKE